MDHNEERRYSLAYLVGYSRGSLDGILKALKWKDYDSALEITQHALDKLREEDPR